MAAQKGREHITKMLENEILPKMKTLNLAREVMRSVYRWLDRIHADARSILGIVGWMAAAKNIDEWWKREFCKYVFMKERRLRRRSFVDAHLFIE